MKLNIHWPSTPRNTYVPWYLILWRLPLYVLAKLLRLVLCVVLFAGWGRSVAIQEWRN